ncbi:MAG: hypothetical protein ACYCZ7_01945 [Minisyncoccota bacterium]
MSEQETSKEERKTSSWWPRVLIGLIIGVLAFLGGVEHAKVAEMADIETSTLKRELVQTKDKLTLCELKPSCDKKRDVLKNKVHRHAAPKPFVSPPMVRKKSFDPKVCGEGTEAVISKVTGMPECRSMSAPLPVVVKAEAPKKPEVVCEKPLRRVLRDDGTIACTTTPRLVERVVPAGCFMDGPRLMCPVQEEASSSGSWVPWVIGAAILGYGVSAINDHKRHTLPPAASSPPGITTFPPGLPGVTTH